MRLPAKSLKTGTHVFLAEATRVNAELMEPALRRVLNQQRFIFTAGAFSSKEALNLLGGQMPDLALLSVQLVDGPFMGFTVLRRLRILWPKTRVVMLVDHSTRELVIETFSHGAHGLFERNTSVNALCQCVRSVASGHIWASSEELQHLVYAFASIPVRAVTANGASILSKREEKIVELVSAGLTNPEIASSLELSAHTIRNYVYRIYNKLGVSNRVELAMHTRGGRCDLNGQPETKENIKVANPDKDGTESVCAI